jgi:hypothetical protein
MYFRFVGLLTLALALTLNIADVVPPLQDYGDWVYQGFLLKLIATGNDTIVTIKPWPVPNAISPVVLAAGMLVSSPIVAAKAFVCVYLVAFTLICHWLTATDKGQSDPRFILLVLLGILDSAYWSGYVNFQVGLLLLLFYIGAHRRKQPLSLPFEILFGILIFFSHAICLGGFLLYVGWSSLLRRQLARGITIALPSIILLGWYVLANRTTAPQIDPEGRGSVIAFAIYKVYTLAKLGPYQNFIVDGAGDYDRNVVLYYTGVVANLGFVALFVGPLFLSNIVAVARRRFTPESLTALFCLGGFLVLPSTLFGVVNIGERVLTIGIILALLAVDLSPVVLRAGGGLACVMPLVVVGGLIATLGVNSSRTLPATLISDPNQTYHLLFWHRSFEFLDQIRAAQEAASSGVLPTNQIGFDTGVIVLRHPGQPR